LNFSFLELISFFIKINIFFRFSPEDDALILEEVKKSGANSKTWKKLCLKLNRQQASTVLNRYDLLISANLTGPWTLQEDEILLEHFFSGKKDSTVQDIRDISIHGIRSLESKLSRY
jgi:hypothetical protein